MTLIIVLNLIACAAVVAGVVTPLAWAIRTQHRDDPAFVAAQRAARRMRAKAARPRRSPAYEGI